MTTNTWTERLLDQSERHWTHALRPRLDGLSDEEYLWEPVSSWNVRPGDRGTRIDFAFPEPDGGTL